MKVHIEEGREKVRLNVKYITKTGACEGQRNDYYREREWNLRVATFRERNRRWEEEEDSECWNLILILIILPFFLFSFPLSLDISFINPVSSLCHTWWETLSPFSHMYIEIERDKIKRGRRKERNYMRHKRAELWKRVAVSLSLLFFLEDYIYKRNDFQCVIQVMQKVLFPLSLLCILFPSRIRHKTDRILDRGKEGDGNKWMDSECSSLIHRFSVPFIIIIESFYFYRLPSHSFLSGSPFP